jgi:hypothetical protein
MACGQSRYPEWAALNILTPTQGLPEAALTQIPPTRDALRGCDRARAFPRKTRCPSACAEFDSAMKATVGGCLEQLLLFGAQKANALF